MNARTPEEMAALVQIDLSAVDLLSADQAPAPAPAADVQAAATDEAPDLVEQINEVLAQVQANAPKPGAGRGRGWGAGPLNAKGVLKTFEKIRADVDKGERADCDIARVMRGEFASVCGGDRSSIDLFVCCEAIRRGARAFDVVCEALRGTPAGDRDKAEREDYLGRTVGRAAGMVLAELQEDEDSSSSSAGPGEVAAVIEAAGFTPILDALGVLHIVELRTVDGRKVRDVMKVTSTEAKDAIRTAVVRRLGKAASDGAIENALSLMRHAHKHDAKREFHVRASGDPKEVFIRLKAGHVAHITASTVQVVDEAGSAVPYFVAGPAGAMPDPDFDGDAAQALTYLLERLKSWNIADRDAHLLIAVMLTWHLSGSSLPVMELTGEPGSGKTELTKFVAGLIDPSHDGGIRNDGPDRTDIAAAAQSYRLLMMDNMSKIDAKLSDVLCKISTGGSEQARQFHTQDKTVSLDVHRPMLINSVVPVCKRPDLLSRVIRVELGKLKARAGTTEWTDGVTETRAKDLGALLRLLQGALGMWDIAPRSPHRMGDFDRMGGAMVMAAGGEPGAFIAWAQESRAEIGQQSIAGDSFLNVLRLALLGRGKNPTHDRKQNPKQTAGADIVSYTYLGENNELRAGVDVRADELMRCHSASTVRACARRSNALNLAKSFSIGFRSGE